MPKNNIFPVGYVLLHCVLQLFNLGGLGGSDYLGDDVNIGMRIVKSFWCVGDNFTEKSGMMTSQYCHRYRKKCQKSVNVVLILDDLKKLVSAPKPSVDLNPMNQSEQGENTAYGAKRGKKGTRCKGRENGASAKYCS